VAQQNTNFQFNTNVVANLFFFKCKQS